VNAIYNEEMEIVQL